MARKTSSIKVLGGSGSVGKAKVQRGSGVPTVTKTSKLAPPAAGYVRFLDEAASVAVEVETMSTPRMLPDSYDGLESVRRRQGVALNRSNGSNALRQELEVLMDAQEGQDVEDEFKALERLARPPHGKRRPSLQVAGPIFHADRAWLLEQLVMSTDEDGVVRDSRNRLVHVELRLVLVQDVAIPLDGDPEPVARTAREKEKPRYTKVAKGESISDVAERALKSRRRGRELARLNGLGDPNRKLPVGTRLRLPAT